MKQEESKVLRLGTLWGRHLGYSPVAITMAVVVVALSVMPSVLGLIGFDLGLGEPLPPRFTAEGRGLTRTFFGAIFEWVSVFCAAVVALFAWGRSRITGGFESRLLAVTLLFAALLDGLHAWAVWTPRTAQIEPETWFWVLARTYLASALLVSVASVFSLESMAKARRRAAVLPALLAIPALVVAGMAYRGALPALVPPWDPMLPRPWDAPALLLFLALALLVLPELHRRHPSILSYALVLSTVPQVLAQLEMVFGSLWEGDAHFVIAHWQKFIAYLTLLGGVAFDYIEAQHGRRFAEHGFKTAQRDLRERTQELERIDRVRVVEEHKRRNAERSLLMLEKAVQTMSLGVTIAEPTGKILYVNPAEARAHGYEVADLLGRNAKIFAAKREGSAAPTRPIENWTRERIDVTRDGREFPVRLVSDWVRDEEGRPIARVTLSEDITERRALDRMKQDFISNVSHELRTPLTSIIASLRLLESPRLDAGSERRAELLAVASRNGQRLLQLINELLDLQKLGAGKVSFETGPIGVPELLGEALENLRSLAESCGIELEVGVVDDSLRILADRDRVMQVLNNLLSNAIKFSPSGAKVVLGGERQGARVVLTVSDRGPGIADEFKDRLFEPFSQADGSSARRSDGSGLGLSIVKNLVEGMGGKVTFRTRLGEGTTFEVRLPPAP